MDISVVFDSFVKLLSIFLKNYVITLENELKYIQLHIQMKLYYDE